MVRVKYSSELYHYGIKGQQWGLRRYQYEDGSLTAAGRIRYGVGEKQNRAFSLDELAGMERTRKDRLKYNKLRDKQIKKVMKGKTKKFSDRDLQLLNDRLAEEVRARENSNRYKRTKYEKKTDALEAATRYLALSAGVLGAGTALVKGIRKTNKVLKDPNIMSDDNNNGGGGGDNSGRRGDYYDGFVYQKNINKAPFMQIGGGNKKKKDKNKYEGGRN